MCKGVKELILLRRTGESAEQYLDSVRGVLEELGIQQILSAAALVATSLRSGGLIHMFGAGHSLLLAIEAFFRAGGRVGVNRILDRRLLFDGGVIESTEFERTEPLLQNIPVIPRGEKISGQFFPLLIDPASCRAEKTN